MKYLILSLFLSYSLSFTQNLTYEYNRKFVYGLGDNVATELIFFNNTKKVPIIKKHYENTENVNNQTIVDFPFFVNKKKIKFQGEVFNKKYLIASGYTLDEKELELYKFFKTKDIYVIKKMDCNEYKAQIGNTKSYLKVYTTNLKDQIDYNPIRKELEKFVNCKLPIFENGEIVVEVAMLTLPDIYQPYLTFQKSENINLEFTFNKEQIEHLITRKKLKEPENLKIPSYCWVENHETKDDKVDENVGQFLQKMCEYYELYGFENVKDYSEFFKSEIIRLANKYQQYKNLNKTQISEFKRILNDYSNTNQTFLLKK